MKTWRAGGTPTAFLPATRPCRMIKIQVCHSERSEESHVFHAFGNTDSSAKASESHCDTDSLRVDEGDLCASCTLL